MTDSALHGVAAARVDARGRKAKKVAYISAGLMVVIFSAVAFTLRGKTDSGRSEFHVEDQIAMTLLGLVAAAGVLMFTRPRIIADADGVRVRNLLAWKYFPWRLIAAVRFDRGSPWVALDLYDDDVISVMAVQAVDKEYALDTVRALRRLLAASRERPDDTAASRERPDDTAASRGRANNTAASRERLDDAAVIRERLDDTAVIRGRPVEAAADGDGAPAF